MKLIDHIFHFTETLPYSDRAVLKTLSILSFVCLIWAGAMISARAATAVPLYGGTLREGVIGTPRFINPLLAVTTADKDMVALIYRGLMRLGPDGTLVPDMAESVTISSDGLTYNIILKNNLTFHDGTPVTSADVLFTIMRIQNPELKSPSLSNWEGVTTENISENEFNLVLSQAYAPFIENLTLGILPKHIWESASTEELPFSNYNSEPIGSGPYKVISTKRNNSGIPASYTLKAFSNYPQGAPHIENLKIFFYPNEDALVDALIAKKIESVANLSPSAIARIMDTPGLKEEYTLYRSPLPRTFVLFLNQNENPALRDLSARQALNTALDRERIVTEILQGYGAPIDGPLPPGFGIDTTYHASTTGLTRTETAQEILRKGGWKVNQATALWEKKVGDAIVPLALSISTVNTPSFEGTAVAIQQAWQSLGVPVDIKKFEQTDLTQSVIRPRKYETLLFGTVLGRSLDFYSFWHSSQRNDPGLNVALYANILTDSVLAEARSTLDVEARKTANARFAEEMKTDLPALFLYVPEFTYLAPTRVKDISFVGISGSSERFSRIEEWYIDTESVWPFFIQKIQK